MLAGGLGQEKAWQGLFTDPARNPQVLAKFNSDMAASRGGTGIIANKWYDAKKHYFTDPKLNRMRELFLAGNLRQLFKEFPRGAPGPKGVNTISGGRLIAADMPGVLPDDPKALAAWKFWKGNNATGQELSLSKMNVRRSGNNIVPARKIPVGVIHDFYDNYLIFGHKWICMPKQIEEMKNGVYTGAGDLGGLYEIAPVDLCLPPPPSKVKTWAMTIAMIVAFYYVGPMIMQGVGAATGGVVGTGAGTAAGTAAGGTAAGTAASTATQAATWFQRIKAGTSTFLNYVNNARTIEAVVKGELPPPPISIQGASFREWAMIVAKKEIKDKAIDYALEKGTEYVAKKMSEKEEAKLRKEIAAMQRELIALTPKEVLNAPPEPSPLLAAPLRKIQQIEIDKKAESDKTLETLLAVSIPAILILKGA